MKYITLVSLVFAVAHALQNGLSINEDLNDEWLLYQMKHGKVYEEMEELSRRLIWEDNVKYIQEHNIRYNLGQHSYYLGINQFSDLTHEEFLAKYIGSVRPSKLNNSAIFMAPLNVDQLPKTMDWRDKGYVTPVKTQGDCGSCWALSATGSLEGQYFRKNKKLVSFSEQQLVDCSGAFGNNGCKNGYVTKAFDYIKQNGIEEEAIYPYTAKDGTCNYKVAKVVTKIAGYCDIPSGNEQDLMVAVATQGPISVNIDTKNKSFMSYSGGVYNEPSCSSTKLDHAVLVIGYGTEKANKYWLVKNNWGVNWGLNGYIKMSKDKNNQCGIATRASYPIL